MLAGARARAIVIGGGPAGLFLAARIGSLAGGPVVLLERGARPGRKLLASGSGRCNITHDASISEFLARYGDKGRFLKKSLYAFTNEDLESWFLERGLAFSREEGGKIFPSTHRASDVLSRLVAECVAARVEIRANARAIAVRSIDAGYEIGLEGADGSSLQASCLAITTGGRSYPATGSDGDGYRLASSLGHGLVEPRPALSPVFVRNFALAELAGLSFEGLDFAVRREGRKVAQERGDLLITHDGFSGPGILDASRGILPGDLLQLDFGGIGLDAFRAGLDSLCSSSPRSLVRKALAELGLPRRMAELFCTLAGLGEGSTCAILGRESRRTLAEMACAYPAEVLALGGFDKAMVTAGGIPLEEVDPATMESRIAPGLFFAGEVLDYDGDTGGFNLQAAFSTAAAAAAAIAARLGAKPAPR